MTVRVQVVLGEKEKELFQRQARREGLSLSVWLRRAGEERLGRRKTSSKMETVEDLRAFFASCDQREKGREPDHEIDAVDLVRRIRDDLYEETKNLSREELIEFYHRRAAATKLWFHHPEMQERIAQAESDFLEGRSTRTNTPKEAQALLDSLKQRSKK